MRTIAAAALAAMLFAGAVYAQAPVIVDHEVIGMRRIDFVFSTPMNAHTVENTENSALYPAGSPGEELEPWAIFLAPGGITMRVTLKEGMTIGGSYVLALDGVTSSGGVPVEEGYTFAFAALDLVAPGLHSVACLDADGIDIVFTEDIVETEGETAASYLLYETATPANVIGFADVRMRGVKNRVFLRLDSPLSIGTQYTIEADGLHDPSGNELPAGSALSFTYDGGVDRPLAGLYLDDERHNTAIDGAGIYTVDMYIWVRPQAEGFSTTMFKIDYPPNIIPENLQLQPPLTVLNGDIYNGIAIYSGNCKYGWTFIGKQRLTVTDHAPSIVTMSSYPSTPVTAASPYVIECAKNKNVVMGITSNIEINVADARPVAVDASFSGYTVIDILFNVPMDETTAETVSNYEVFETAAPGNTVTVSSAELLDEAQTVRLVTATDLTQGTEYTARITGVENALGTAIYPGSEIEFSAVDAEAPHLLSAALSGERTIDLPFNEPLGELSASSMANYTIAESAYPSNQLALYSAELLDDDVTVRLTVSGSLADGTEYTAEARNVADLRGNRMPAAESADFTADDVYPPQVVHVSSLAGGCVRVHFDQELDQTTAEDLDNYRLLYFTDWVPVAITSVVWEGSSVLLEAPGMSMGRSYWLYTVGIEDTEGNAIPTEQLTKFYYTPEIPSPQIGLWSDLNRSEDYVAAYPFQPFEFYVWCKPGPNGLIVVEYALAERSINDFEYGIINIVNDPDVSFSLGDPLSGVAVAMKNCKEEWFWISKCTAFLLHGNGYLEVVPHPVGGGPNGASCFDNYPTVYLEPVNELSLSTVVATLLRSSSAELTDDGIAVRWTMSEIDEGIEFTILRKGGKEDEFGLAPSQGITRDGLEFEYLDADIERGSSYTYRIDYTDGDRTRTLFQTEAIETPALPLVLEQNRPNPFNPSTEIRFSIPQRCSVRLEVFDTAGRLIKILRDGAMNAGAHSIMWDGTNDAGRAVGSGIYFYRLSAGKEKIAKKMVLLR
jgi:hypothetical protein